LSGDEIDLGKRPCIYGRKAPFIMPPGFLHASKIWISGKKKKFVQEKEAEKKNNKCLRDAPF